MSTSPVQNGGGTNGNSDVTASSTSSSSLDFFGQSSISSGDLPLYTLAVGSNEEARSTKESVSLDEFQKKLSKNIKAFLSGLILTALDNTSLQKLINASSSILNFDPDEIVQDQRGKDGKLVQDANDILEEYNSYLEGFQDDISHLNESGTSLDITRRLNQTSNTLAILEQSFEEALAAFRGRAITFEEFQAAVVPIMNDYVSVYQNAIVTPYTAFQSKVDLYNSLLDSLGQNNSGIPSETSWDNLQRQVTSRNGDDSFPPLADLPDYPGAVDTSGALRLDRGKNVPSINFPTSSQLEQGDVDGFISLAEAAFSSVRTDITDYKIASRNASTRSSSNSNFLDGLPDPIPLLEQASLNDYYRVFFANFVSRLSDQTARLLLGSLGIINDSNDSPLGLFEEVSAKKGTIFAPKIFGATAISGINPQSSQDENQQELHQITSSFVKETVTSLERKDGVSLDDSNLQEDILKGFLTILTMMTISSAGNAMNMLPEDGLSQSDESTGKKALSLSMLDQINQVNGENLDSIIKEVLGSFQQLEVALGDSEELQKVYEGFIEVVRGKIVSSLVGDEFALSAQATNQAEAYVQAIAFGNLGVAKGIDGDISLPNQAMQPQAVGTAEKKGLSSDEQALIANSAKNLSQNEIESLLSSLPRGNFLSLLPSAISSPNGHKYLTGVLGVVLGSKAATSAANLIQMTPKDSPPLTPNQLYSLLDQAIGDGSQGQTAAAFIKLLQDETHYRIDQLGFSEKDSRGSLKTSKILEKNLTRVLTDYANTTFRNFSFNEDRVGDKNFGEQVARKAHSLNQIFDNPVLSKTIDQQLNVGWNVLSQSLAMRQTSPGNIPTPDSKTTTIFQV